MLCTICSPSSRWPPPRPSFPLLYPHSLYTPTLTSFLFTNSPGIFPPEGLNNDWSLDLEISFLDIDTAHALSLPSSLDSTVTFLVKPFLITWFKSPSCSHPATSYLSFLLYLSLCQLPLSNIFHTYFTCLFVIICLGGEIFVCFVNCWIPTPR